MHGQEQYVLLLIEPEQNASKQRSFGEIKRVLCLFPDNLIYLGLTISTRLQMQIDDGKIQTRGR